MLIANTSRNEQLFGTDDTLLTEDQVAKHLQLSKSWCQQARARGEGPAWIKMGHSVRYTLGAVNKWLTACAARAAK